MPGFSSVTGLESIMFTDNCSFDGTKRSGAMTTDGQLWIGSTTGRHVKVGTLTSPNGTVNIGYNSPNITLDVEDAGFVWVDQAGTFTAAKNTGYFITGTATANLPAAPSQGDTIKFFVDHASQVLTIDAPGTQIIRVGNQVTAAGGTAVSTAQGDSLELTYRSSDTCWCAIAGFSGNWVIT